MRQISKSFDLTFTVLDCLFQHLPPLTECPLFLFTDRFEVECFVTAFYLNGKTGIVEADVGRYYIEIEVIYNLIATSHTQLGVDELQIISGTLHQTLCT